MNFFYKVAEFPVIAPIIFIAVFALSTKDIFACDTYIGSADATSDTELFLGAITYCASDHFPIIP